MIFPWIWKSLPGKPIVKTLELVLITGLTITLLFLFVFPEISSLFTDSPVVERPR